MTKTSGLFNWRKGGFQMELNRILVVDDEANVRDVLYQGLTKFGYKVALANSGEEALRIFEPGFFDIVITDLKMPKMDGLDLIRIARKKDPGVAFFVITGYPTLQSAAETLYQGVHDYIIKPLNFGDIRLRISRVMDKKQLQRSVRLVRKIIWGLVISIPFWIAIGGYFVK
jgi:DNA-binding NtrC family response regulator